MAKNFDGCLDLQQVGTLYINGPTAMNQTTVYQWKAMF